MGILGEFLIIAAVAAAGVIIALIPGFPLPGTVTGMIIMLVLLGSEIIRLDRIKTAAGFFINFLPFFFIPLVVNIIKQQQLISRYGIKLLLLIFFTTIITMLVTGFTAVILLRLNRERNHK